MLKDAIVTTASRRFVSLSLPDGQAIQAKTSAKTLDIAVGDSVRFESRDDDNFIVEISARRNELARGYRGELKVMAANLDLVIIVTAVGFGFNPIFVDKVLSYAYCQGIPVALVINKVDQGLEETENQINIYKNLGHRVFCISAKFGIALNELESYLSDPELKSAALVGISGVGKSTMLNHFVPDAKTRTNEINEKTGLGRQTTTQALAHVYSRPQSGPMYLVDLPGLQSFGVGHLDKALVAESFLEFGEFRANCGFSNCSHVRELDCAVKTAVEAGQIAESRYNSYLKMIQEIEDNQKY